MTGHRLEKEEQKAFLKPGVKKVNYFRAKHCDMVSVGMAAGVLGCFLLLLSISVLLGGPQLLEKIILANMALKEGSQMTNFWLSPPVQSQLSGYAFHVTNPEEVQRGAKPVLEEIGPFVYTSVIVKNSENAETGDTNLKYNRDGETLTYRPRHFYQIDLSSSISDPTTTFITVPNIPLLTAFSNIRDMGWGKAMAARVVENTDLGTPFINVSFDGLLWGYEDELPCIKMARPDECGPPKGEKDIFAEEDGWSEDGWRRRRRDAEFVEKANAEIVDCKCEVGLLRDWDGTLKEPTRMYHGVSDLSKRGWVKEFNSSPTLGWWEPGSTCDQAGGHDGGILPTGIEPSKSLEVWISLVCRRISLEFEKNTSHSGLQTYRYAPPQSALGSHTDGNLSTQNLNNSCYCLDHQGFACLKSGVFNMEPCKVTQDTPKGSPIALSWPHFYQADPSFLAAVSGLKPKKEKHQFYLDVSPEFGIPLAVRPRLQINAIIRKDEDIENMSKFADELILPLLWVQDGFSEPSQEMLDLVKFCLSAPHRFSLIGGILLSGLGFVLLVMAGYTWRRGLAGQNK